MLALAIHDRPLLPPRDVIQVQELRIDKDAYRVTVGGSDVALTRLQYKLLLTLIDRRDRVQTREALLGAVWETEDWTTGRPVDIQVKRLRDKLRGAARFIQSVRGVGYRFSELPEPHPTPPRVGGRAPRTAPEAVSAPVVRRALAVVRRGLGQLPRSPQALELAEQAERLLAATGSWQEFPPSRATCERVMRAVMSIHLEALRAASSDV